MAQIENLFVIDEIDGRTVILGVLSKLDQAVRFTPLPIDHSTRFLWTRNSILTVGLPQYITHRLPHKEHRKTQELLDKYGLEEYDEWEVLKLTQGSIHSDKLRFVSNI